MKRIILSLGTIAFVAAGLVAASGAFFTDTASATGNVFTSGTLNLVIAQDNNGTPGGWQESQNAQWVFSKMAPGGTPDISTVWLKNEGNIDGQHLGVKVAAANETVGGFESLVRITKLMLGTTNLLVGGAGASIGDYVAPTGCTVTVDPSGTPSRIQATIDSAAVTTGAVVCVKPGTYTSGWESGASQISVNKAITLVSIAGPDTTEIQIPVVVSAANATVRGFKISNPNGSAGVQVNGVGGVSVLDNKITNVGTGITGRGSAQGVYLAGGVGVAGFTVKGNIITNIGNASLLHDGGNGSSAKGVYIGTTSGTGSITGVDVENNIITNVTASPAPFIGSEGGYGGGAGAYGVLINYGAKSSGTTAAPVIKNNTISNLDGLWATAIGLEGPTPGATRVTYNDISNLVNHKPVNDSTGVKVEDNTGTNIVINKNNFAPNVAYGVAQTKTSGASPINATNNWWGDLTPADNVYTADPAAYINTASPENGPVAGLLPSGDGSNANGYADFQDLRLNPVASSPATLDAGVSKQLVMAVQLDGPNTTNPYKGESLTSSIEFTLSQE